MYRRLGGPRADLEGLGEKKINFASDGNQNLDRTADSIVTVLTELLLVIIDILQKPLGVLNGSAELQ